MEMQFRLMRQRAAGRLKPKKNKCCQLFFVLCFVVTCGVIILTIMNYIERKYFKGATNVNSDAAVKESRIFSTEFSGGTLAQGVPAHRDTFESTSDEDRDGEYYHKDANDLEHDDYGSIEALEKMTKSKSFGNIGNGNKRCPIQELPSFNDLLQVGDNTGPGKALFLLQLSRKSNRGDDGNNYGVEKLEADASVQWKPIKKALHVLQKDMARNWMRYFRAEPQRRQKATQGDAAVALIPTAGQQGQVQYNEGTGNRGGVGVLLNVDVRGRKLHHKTKHGKDHSHQNRVKSVMKRRAAFGKEWGMGFEMKEEKTGMKSERVSSFEKKRGVGQKRNEKVKLRKRRHIGEDLLAGVHEALATITGDNDETLLTQRDEQQMKSRSANANEEQDQAADINKQDEEKKKQIVNSGVLKRGSVKTAESKTKKEMRQISDEVAEEAKQAAGLSENAIEKISEDLQGSDNVDVHEDLRKREEAKKSMSMEYLEADSEDHLLRRRQPSEMFYLELEDDADLDGRRRRYYYDDDRAWYRFRPRDYESRQRRHHYYGDEDHDDDDDERYRAHSEGRMHDDEDEDEYKRKHYHKGKKIKANKHHDSRVRQHGSIKPKTDDNGDDDDIKGVKKDETADEIDDFTKKSKRLVAAERNSQKSLAIFDSEDNAASKQKQSEEFEKAEKEEKEETIGKDEAKKTGKYIEKQKKTEE